MVRQACTTDRFYLQLTELACESGEGETCRGTPVKRHDVQASLGLLLSFRISSNLILIGRFDVRRL